MIQKETTNTIFEFLGKTIVGATIFALAVIFRGYVVSYLWLWFIVPIWGWDTLTITQSIGLAFVCAVLTHGSSNKNKNEEFDFLKLIGNAIAKNIAFLLIGWIVYYFIQILP